MSYLWLTRWAPYLPLKGGDIDYSRELMKSLAACAPVHGLVFAAPGVTPAPDPGLTWQEVRFNEPPRMASLASRLPNVAFRHESAAYLDAAVEAAKGAEAVFVDFIGLFWLVKPLIRRLDAAMGQRRPPVLVVDHNFEHAIRRQMVVNEHFLPMRALLALDAWKAGQLEREANAIADGLVANTDADAEAFAQIVKTPSVTVTPAYAGRRLPPRVIGAETPARICILGAHEAHHKKMVLDMTLAALTKRGVEKTCIIDVVGAGDSTAFKAKYPGVNFQGFVDDISDYLATVRFGLVPDEIGGGFKHRALMHAFQRTPMLALYKALAGMGFTSGEHYMGVETLDDMAAAIPALLTNFELLNRIQTNAYLHCEHAYDWADRGQTLHGFVQTLRPAR